jgi:hypothetical protein
VFLTDIIATDDIVAELCAMMADLGLLLAKGHGPVQNIIGTTCT